MYNIDKFSLGFESIVVNYRLVEVVGFFKYKYGESLNLGFIYL